MNKLFKRKPKHIKIKINFELSTKKLRVVVKPKNTKPTVAMELLLEGARLIEEDLLKEIAKKEPIEKPKKAGYIA